MIRSIQLFIIAATALITAGTAVASDLDDAFANIVSTPTTQLTDSGTFKSQLRTTHQLGRFSMRFAGNRGTRTVQLFSIQPPSVDVGCNGIDFTLGGFQYVNGAVVEQMIQTIIGGVTMYVIQMALNALCEDCVAELRSVIDKINKATSMLQNDCQAGQALAAWGFNQLGIDQRTQSNQSRCERISTENGSTSSEISARGDSICKGYQAVSEFLDKKINGLLPGQSAANQDIATSQAASVSAKGNATWMALKAAGIVTEIKDPSGSNGAIRATIDKTDEWGFALGELMMSMIGTEIDGNPVNSTFESKDALEVLMCGTYYFGHPPSAPNATINNSDASTAAELVAQHCSQIFSQTKAGTTANQPSGIYMITCSETAPHLPSNTARFDQCAEIRDVGHRMTLETWMGQSYVASTIGKGFLYHVVDLETSILEKIKTNGAGYTPDEIGLIEAAPFPLYKALNLAALFPSIQGDLIQLTAIPMAYYASAEYFQKLMRQSVGTNRAMPIPPQTFRQIAMQMKGAEDAIGKKIEDIGHQMNQVHQINEQIDQINTVMLRSIHQRNLLGNAGFARDVASLYAPPT